MGKKLRVQRAGKGSPTFKAAKKGRISPVKYPPPAPYKVTGVLKDLVHESGRGAPLAYVEIDVGNGFYSSAAEGVHIGQRVEMGPEAVVSVGNILPVGAIPEGTMVCNIELRPGDGGRVARSSGTYGTVVSRTMSGTTVNLPSKRSIQLSNSCRATVGIVAGGGRREKPFMKAGEKFFLKRAKGQVYPKTKGVSMAAASHPHGGGRHRRPGKSTTVSRRSPPGKKVGLIAARSSGKKKRQRRKDRARRS